jgi:hypothetical protein
MRKMRTKIIVAVITLAFAMVGPHASSARAYQTDSSLEAFWAKFKSAVIKGDKEAVATMSQFPIGMPYGVRTIKTKADLLKRYREVFNVQANAAKCFANAQPTTDATAKNQFTIGCKDAAGNETVIYAFVKTRGIWKLKSLDNINE